MKCKGIYYQYVKKWDLYIGAPPKCGSSSLHAALQTSGLEFWGVRARKIPDGSHIVFIVRQPIDRFRSFWRFSCVPGGDQYHGTGKHLHGKTVAQLWMHMRGHHDKHWELQTNLLEGLQERCDVRLVRLDDLSRWWGTMCRTPLPEVNQTHGRVPIVYVLEESLRKHYAADIQLYEDAK